MTVHLIIGLLLTLLIYLLIVYRAAQAVRHRYPDWRLRGALTSAFVAGPAAILAIGLVAAWIFAGQPAGSEGHDGTGAIFAFATINALAVSAAIPAAFIGYLIARHVIAKERDDAD